MTVLELFGVSKRFGRVNAVNDVSFAVERGDLLAVIGPNGAGKSTVFNAITGIYSLDAGRIEFNGVRIDGRPTFRIAAMGIARTFQNIRLFRFMPAIDNVMAGEHARLHANVFASMLHPPSERREERQARERARELLAFVGLERAADVQAGSLDYGSQRRLEIARALASSPELLLLDEPAAGMNPREKESLRELLHAIRDRGVTQMLVEHDMSLVMNACQRIVVLDHGEKIAQGTPQAIRSDRRVIEAYLGTGA
ncbi:MAG TPA: ABC transporter ATP-binding protein [Verrucomicrobiae bacterium]|jgi:branched-chain amino acid transport system ATP-binding protein|nr:ABC transporter ATP-binding protein [Verrucomicrobiae bacterium]